MISTVSGLRSKDVSECVVSELPARLPYVTGVKAGSIQLRFRRMLVPFSDWYRVNAESSSEGVIIRLEGERSRIAVRVPWDGEPTAEYEGPRAWVVRPALGEIARSAAEAVEACISRGSQEPGPPAGGVPVEDLSERLRSVSWITRLVMRSVLLRNEDVVVPRGGLVSLLEDIVTEYGGTYRTIYVSGTGLATFRVLFIDGRLAGVYVSIGGQERVGDDKALNEVEGVVRLKVYGSLVPPEEVA